MKEKINELTQLERQILIALTDNFAKQLINKLIPQPIKKQEPKNEDPK